jgi:hypothetical protein
MGIAMEQRLLKRLYAFINISLICLVFGAVLSVCYEMFNALLSVGASLFTAVVTFVCYSRANRQMTPTIEYYLWRYIPLFLFVIFPIIWFIFFSSGVGFTAKDWMTLSQIIIGYLMPILLLFYVQRSLKKLINHYEPSATTPEPAEALATDS